MGLFSKLFKGGKEKREFFACAKILFLIASLDQKISEEEIERVLAGLEFLGFNPDNIAQDEIAGIWKEAAEMASAYGFFSPLSEDFSEFLEKAKRDIASFDYEKRIKLVVIAKKVLEVNRKLELKDLDALALLSRAIGVDDKHTCEILSSSLDKVLRKE